MADRPKPSAFNSPSLTATQIVGGVVAGVALLLVAIALVTGVFG